MKFGNGKAFIRIRLRGARLGWPPANFSPPRNVRAGLARPKGANEAGNRRVATLTPNYPVSVSARGTFESTPLSWTRQLRHPKGRTTTGKSKSIRASAEGAEKASGNDPQSELPLLAYYGTGRLWVQKRDKQPQRLGSRMQGYAACLARASNTQLFERWMAWRETARIQAISAALDHGADVSTRQREQEASSLPTTSSFISTPHGSGASSQT